MILQDADAAVLAALRGYGPGNITVRQLHEMTRVASVMVRVAVTALTVDGLVCVIPDEGESRYLVRHLHAEPGECAESLGRVIQEVHPDGQRQ